MSWNGRTRPPAVRRFGGNGFRESGKLDGMERSRSWRPFRGEPGSLPALETLVSIPAGAVDEFLDAACVPLDSSHSSGTLERAQKILAEHPGLEISDMYAAAVTGNDDAVRGFLSADPGSATVAGGPRGWDALTHLCFSRYLRLDRTRSDGIIRAARALLDAGASPNSGWFEKNHQPGPEWESVLYGAAGVAHHPGLTRLLLERGADPNDGEVVYHSPETYDNTVLKLLVETGKLTEESLTTMLIRKHDLHDYAGDKFLLEQNFDLNRRT